MPWAKLSDGFAFNLKVIAAGNEAAGVCCRMISWSAGNGTDGFVPDAIAMMIAGHAGVLERMCTAMRPEGSGLLDRVEGGFVIHGFAEANISAADWAALRENRRKAGQRSAEERAKKRSNEQRGQHVTQHVSPEPEHVSEQVMGKASTLAQLTRPDLTRSDLEVNRPDGIENACGSVQEKLERALERVVDLPSWPEPLAKTAKSFARKVEAHRGEHPDLNDVVRLVFAEKREAMERGAISIGALVARFAQLLNPQVFSDADDACPGGMPSQSNLNERRRRARALAGPEPEVRS